MSPLPLTPPFPTILIYGLPFTITELDIVNVMNHVNMETKVVIEFDPTTSAPRVNLIFRYHHDADRFFATVNGSIFLGSKVQLNFQDQKMNYSTTSGSKTIVARHIPLGVNSLEFYDIARAFGKIISCKVMIDRSGQDSYALLQFENQDHAEKFMQDMHGVNIRGNNISLSWQFNKNAPYLYPTSRTVSHLRTSPSLSSIPSITGGVHVAVAAGWNTMTPPTTPCYLSPSTSPADSSIQHQIQEEQSSTSSQQQKQQSYNPYNSWQTKTIHSQSYPHSYSNDVEGDNNTSNNNNENAFPSFSPSSPTTQLPPYHLVTGWHVHHVPPSVSASVQAITPSPLPSLATAVSETTTTTATTAATATETAVAMAAQRQGLDPRNLYIKNLPETTDTQALYLLFNPFGRIVSARVMLGEGGRSRGFGFVCFETEGMATDALERLDGFVCDGKVIKVSVAEPREFREKKLMALHGSRYQ